VFDGLEICKHGQKYLRSDEVVAFFTARRYDQATAALRTIEDPINEVRGWLTLHDLDQCGRGLVAAGLVKLRRCQTLKPHFLTGYLFAGESAQPPFPR
jgi:hypothetical protein